MISVQRLDRFPIVETNDVIWMWKSNNDPFDSQQPEEWTTYSPNISSHIEYAYNFRISSVCIDENYMIDLNHMLQAHISDPDRQRPVKRNGLSKCDHNTTDWRRERFGFELNQHVQSAEKTNTSVDDVKYYGSKFIADWLLTYTGGKLKLKFNMIYSVLVPGIQIEGKLQEAPKDIIKCLIDALEKVRVEVRKKKEQKRMECLGECCAKLYTKNCFLFRLVNATLRDDDRTKLYTLGPYCYLLYNYMNHGICDYLSLRYRLRQKLRPTEAPSFVVYRGDKVTKGKLDEYEQAAGQRHKYFKWLSFVSTSRQRKVAEFFARNVLYEIELRQTMANDLFADLSANTCIPGEDEVLLRAGVRFRVEKLAFDFESELHIIHIKIVPSYVSNLK